MTITAIPPLDRLSPTFRADTDTYFASRIPTLTVELNTLADDLTIKQGLASAAAIAANNDKITTAGLKDTAQLAADAAASYRTQAKGWADAAADSAKTIGITAAFSDVNPIVKNAADNSKTGRFDLSFISPSTQPVIQWPNKSGKMALIGDGGLAFLGEVTLAAPAAAIDFLTIFNTPAHDRFLITVHYAKAVTDFVPAALRFAVGGVVETGNVYGIAALTGSQTSGSNTLWPLGPTGTNNPKDYEITVYDKNRTLSSSGCTWLHLYGTGTQMFTGSFNPPNPNPISGFRIVTINNTNIAAGAIVRVYGYAKS
ncbi:hypothetical protein [Massilia aquatica]|uniref:Tail fiber protein n=1 Tax=Massilia aquatica TaxID=2609000 RepID=A0ABX0LZX2_9BURK|nr:hypothetical protein [Massilia aquatica]NHZ40122.1 hypothetical protein [Massilia aquatica]